MRVILHVGMHKTGSSSIQDHLFAQDPAEGVRYARWNSGNHSGLFLLLFQDEELVGSHRGFRIRGPDFIASLPEQKRTWMASLEEDCEACRDGTLVISAEAVSGPNFGTAVQRLHDFLQARADEVRVIGYVRSPRSFAQSAFQQILKDKGMTLLDIMTLWPQYQTRFARLDTLFGRENVTLRPYDRKSLFHGDVVADFIREAGLPYPQGGSGEANRSLSAEATALLFLQRSQGEGHVSGFRGAQRQNRTFVESLRSIGQGRFAFADSLWAPVLEENRADLDWMEDRLGVSLDDRADPEAIQVGGEADLTRIALQAQPAVQEILLERLASGPPSVATLVRNLDLLRRLCY
ncbi:hypothetical protein [Rhodobacter sp. CZR27]|uniref:hypothetical protein n=1 Tax=Rhodobacter sp. CZR27 TaxID=2033869 RepID=UPI000BBEFDF1|nr:hypothetical protein [Rhodobacter sp. CZR27]